MVAILCVSAARAFAQQRPLETQDPETIGAGRVLFEAGVSGARDQFYPLSGLRGDLWRLPMLGLDVGVSSIADIQITGGPFDRLLISSREPAPASDLLTVTGTSTHAVDDIVFGAKVRLVSETSQHPSLGFRFETRLPNAKHPSGLGQDTTDFGASLLMGKTIDRIHLIANVGVMIMRAPLDASQQNNVMTYGVSATRAIAPSAEIVAEVTGWASVHGSPPIGTESRGHVTVGTRFKHGPVQVDAGIFFGLHAVDPSVGATAGISYLLNAFRIP